MVFNSLSDSIPSSRRVSVAIKVYDAFSTNSTLTSPTISSLFKSF